MTQFSTTVGIANSIIKKWSFEYFYMIVMLIYACMLTPATCRMSYGLTWDIPFFIPIILTLILIYRNYVNFNNRYFFVLLVIVLLWVVAITIKLRAYYMGFQSYNIFLIYGIVVAYIQIQVYGTSFPNVFEDIMVFFSKISLPLWLLGVVLPGVAASFFHLFSSHQAITGNCYNLFYLYNWFDPATLTTSEEWTSFPRNSGPAFEPGYFASLLCLAILNNVSNNGIVFKNNRNLFILLLALSTTFSTTGYSIALVIFAIFYLKKESGPVILKVLFVVVPVVLIVLQFDFMGAKLTDRANIEEQNYKFYSAESYNSQNGADSHSSLDRFQSLFFEWENIKQDPILGYSRDTSKSWFGKTFISNYSLTGGLLKIVGQFGFLMGFLWYFLLFKSSKAFGLSKEYITKYTLALVMMLISISYGYFGNPVFTTFWLLGGFGYLPKKKFVS